MNKQTSLMIRNTEGSVEYIDGVTEFYRTDEFLIVHSIGLGKTIIPLVFIHTWLEVSRDKTIR